MNEYEQNSLIYWYIALFRCRLCNYKKTGRKLICYIFANSQDMKEYCEINDINCENYRYNDYLLINEKTRINIIGTRITDVILVSSNVPEIVKKICEEAKETKNIGFKSLI